MEAIEDQTVSADGAAPDAAARRRVAVELFRSHGSLLRASARRYSICSEDVEDAVQRGLEIVLAKAPTANHRELLPWARTVVKHEALAIRRSRDRLLAASGSPAEDDEGEDWLATVPSGARGPEELAEVGQRVARSREALRLLKPQELKALTQLAQGFSYVEIARMNGWTRTKVNRCLAEGRQKLRSVVLESETGQRCPGIEARIPAFAAGEADREESVRVIDHLASCGHCRAVLRDHRAHPSRVVDPIGLGAPLGLVGTLLSLPVRAWDRAEAWMASLMGRLSGLSGGSDGLGLAAGGLRETGLVTAVKVAVVCAGAAGGTAACLTTGVVPDPFEGLRSEGSTASQRAMARPEERPALRFAASGPSRPQPVRVDRARSADRSTPGAGNEGDQASGLSSAPAEFAPEAAGIPVADAPAPSPAPTPAIASGSSSASGPSVPLGGGGEFQP